ncbi:MAG: integrase [Rhodanobacter sp.]|nr:MAG: integrase [Rhodanobacter sp.]
MKDHVVTSAQLESVSMPAVRKRRGAGNNQLTLGARWIFERQIVEVNGLLAMGAVSVRFETTGAVAEVPIAALTPLPSPQGSPSLTAISSTEWCRARELAQAIAPLATMSSLPSHLLTPIAKAHALSVRQLQRLVARYRADQRCSSLVRRKRGRPQFLRMLHPDVERVISHVVQKHYLVREPVSKAEIVERARSICRRSGLAVPSAGAIYRRLADCTYEGDAKRLGAKRARQGWEPRPGQLWVSTALEVVQIDHTLVDILVLSDDRVDVLGRPWISVAFDVGTRVVLGLFLSMDAPSSTAVSLCIAHAVLPKVEDARAPGLWPMFGKMKVIHVDNGADLVSAAMRRGCEQYGIELRTRPLGKAHYGGHIERMMGTLMRLIHGLPGTTFSNVQQRGDYPSEARATMTLSELNDWITQKIGRYYHVRVHRMLGVPPLVAWERAWRCSDGQIVAPPMVSCPDEFRVDFLPFVTRRLQRTGVLYRRARYWSEALACQVRPGRVVQVHYDPRDPTRVWVRLDGDRIVTAEAVTGTGAGQPQQAKLDPVTRQRLETQLDQGFIESDRIEHMAASATRAQQRKRSRCAKGSPGVSAKWRQDEAGYSIPLNRSRIKVTRTD